MKIFHHNEAPWSQRHPPVGFQSTDYALNFLDCCERGLGTRVDRGLMMVEHGAGGRKVKVLSLPLGIPFERFGALAEKAPRADFDVGRSRDRKVVIRSERFSPETVEFEIFSCCIVWTLWTTPRVSTTELPPSSDCWRNITFTDTRWSLTESGGK